MSLDPKVLYWTGALANMLLIAVFAARGVLQVKRGDVVGHRRSMLVCTVLVVAFLVSYAGKVALLGREALSTWGGFYVNVLRFHETCVLVMVVGGGIALQRAYAMRGTRSRTRIASDPATAPGTAKMHRVAGRTAVGGLVLALLSAGVVLFGMYARL